MLKYVIRGRHYQGQSATILPVGPTDTGKRGYLIASQGQAALIDAVEPVDSVIRLLHANRLTLRYILITHAHSSRIIHAPHIREACGGLLGLHAFDEPLMVEIAPGVAPDILLGDRQKLSLGAATIHALHTPGHTRGAMSYYLRCADALFTGSTLLKGGHGRIWGPKSMSLMVCSLKRLNNNYYGRTRVFPGSGDSTTMEAEGWMNYLRSA